MIDSDLPNLRRVALSGAITYSHHAQEQMLNRGVLVDDVEAILKSPTNQLIEIQSPSKQPGKEHREERDLIYDPEYAKDVIVIITLLFSPLLEIRVITVENPETEKWSKQLGKNPSLVRKK